jgi:hypothetical protein
MSRKHFLFASVLEPRAPRIASSAYRRNSSAFDMTCSQLGGMPCNRHLHQPSAACAHSAAGVWSKQLCWNISLRGGYFGVCAELISAFSSLVRSLPAMCSVEEPSDFSWCLMSSTQLPRLCKLKCAFQRCGVTIYHSLGSTPSTSCRLPEPAPISDGSVLILALNKHFPELCFRIIVQEYAGGESLEERSENDVRRQTANPFKQRLANKLRDTFRVLGTEFASTGESATQRTGNSALQDCFQERDGRETAAVAPFPQGPASSRQFSELYFGTISSRKRRGLW